MDYFKAPTAKEFNIPTKAPGPLATRLAGHIVEWLEKKSGVPVKPDFEPVAVGRISDRSAYHMPERIEPNAMARNGPFSLPAVWQLFKWPDGRQRLVIGYLGDEEAIPTPVAVPGRDGLSVQVGLYSGRIQSLDIEPGADVSQIENLYLPADLGRLWAAKTGRTVIARRTAAIVNCVLKYEQKKILKALQAPVRALEKSEGKIEAKKDRAAIANW